LQDEGLEVRRILRIYPPMDTGANLEVLFVSYDGRAGTVLVGPDAQLVRGPLKGFGT
jgi:hypothetical protein